MVHSPGKDILSTMQIFEGTYSEQALAVRPLGSWINGYQNVQGARIPVPVIAVEWHLSKKVDGGVAKRQQFMAGLRRGTIFEGIIPENLEEFEAVVQILKENRKALDVRNEIHHLEKHCTDKSWRFSVICPADPNQKGYVVCCKVCNEPAKNKCSRCKTMNYCGQDCQRAHWKVHKKTCVAKVSTKKS
uniref:MYND-type domain-containing protein n=1 Tax=Proboscia inermis TaxID=420281 RepID=A0A7S0C5T9_9STRA|mmetsp:Transcript_28912/g.29279  ORF Transcript_28912/g.29279 Transcript_28912/m.29279 type:complete len:188 (+) Transcript_28912:3-566(+)